MQHFDFKRPETLPPSKPRRRSARLSQRQRAHQARATADEAFALSPISARPALPSEADYDAIKEAFMETSRGRWFLGEYAKRNRNADTSMVLDAVARIEETLAAQKKPVRDPLLDEALASFRAALAEARAAATAALGDLALEQNLAPVRKGARVIREIAWRLREIGADGRICDLINSQVAAIEGAAVNVDLAGLAAALEAAFDRIEGKISGFDADAEVAAGSPPAQAETAATGQAVADEPSTAEVAASEPTDVFDSNDEAMLDMVAMEMAAPDTDAAYEAPMDEAESDEPQVDGAEILEAQVDGVQVHEHKVNTPKAEKVQESAASYEIDVTFASRNRSG